MGYRAERQTMAKNDNMQCSFFDEADREEPSRCSQCGFFVELKAPFHYEKEGYPEGVTVYGFCSKDVTRNFYFYPVYLPDGGICKSFKKLSGKRGV